MARQKSTIQLLIESTFDSTGINEAIDSIQQASRSIEKTTLTAMGWRGGGGSLDDIENVKKLTTALDELAKRKAQIAISAVNEGRIDIARNFLKQRDAIKTLSSEFKTLIPKAKEASEALRRTVPSLAAQQYDEAAAGIRKMRQELEKMSRIGSDRDSILQSLRMVPGGGQGIKKALDDMIASEQRVKAGAEEMGDAFRMFGSADRIKTLESIKNTLFDTGKNMKLMGKEVGFFGQIMQSSFNQFGFALFVTESTLKSVFKVLRGINDFLLSGAKGIEQTAAFARSLQQTGLNADQFKASLESASRSAIDMNTQMAGVNRIVNEGLPQFAASAEMLSKMAVNAALLAGDSSKAGAIYTELVEAVVSGNAGMVSSSDGVLNLSAAMAEMEIASRNAGRELTDLEKSQIVLENITNLAPQLEQAAQGLDVQGQSIRDFNQDLKELYSSSAIVATSFSEIFSMATGVGTGFESVRKNTADVAIAILALASIVAIPFDMMVVEIGKAATALVKFRDLIRSVADPDLPADQAFLDLKAAITDTVNISDTFKQAIDQAFEAFSFGSEKIRRDLGLITSDAQQTGEALQGAFAPDLSAFDRMRAALEALIGPEAEFKRSIQELWEDYWDRVNEIAEEKNDKLAEIILRRDERIKEAARRQQEQLEEINENLADSLADIDEDADERREDAQDKFNKRRIKLEEDYQKRIRDILRRYELDRMRALIDRDARALFEAEMRRNSDLASAKEDFDEKKQEADLAYQEELEDIREQNEKKRQEAIEAAEERRRDAIEQFERERREALEQYKMARKEAEKEFKEQLQELKENYKEREKDMKASFERQRLTQKIQMTLQNLEQERLLASNEKDFDGFLQRRETAIQEYMDLLAELATAQYNAFGDLPTDIVGGGTGGTGGGTGGTGGGGNTIPYCVQQGMACNYTSGQGIFTDPCGNRWICIGGYWRQVNSSAPTGTASNIAPGGAFAPVGLSTTPNGVGGGMKATLVVQNSQTLDAILREMAAEVFIEITS